MASAKVAKKAAKVDESSLRDYELVVIISPEAGDDAIEAAMESVSKFVTGSGGTVPDVERWGKRKLAYPIKSFLEGNYVLARFKLNTALSNQLEASLHISEDVLRHLLIRLDS